MIIGVLEKIDLEIKESERKNSLLEILSDKYCRIIIESTRHKPKSAMEITSGTNIPISTVYRKIQSLHDNKLLSTSGSISVDGKKFFLYKSRIRGIKSTFKDGQIDVEIILNQ